MDLLRGLRVAESGESTAVRFCGKLLAGLGASVVRWTRPGGSGGQSAAVADYLRHDLAGEVALAEGGAPGEGPEFDVLVSDGEGARLLRQALDQGKVAVALTPFGRGGTCGGWRGGDLQIQALSGLCALVGEPDRHPLYVPYEFAQMVQGMHGAGAAMAGVLSGTGGQLVDVAGADAMAAFTRMYSMLYRQYGIAPRRSGHRAPGSGGRYPFGIFPCKDGYVALIGRYKDDWNRYLAMMGNPAWSREFEGVDEFALATEYADQVDRRMIPWLMQHTREEIAAMGRSHNLPVAPVRWMEEVLEDVQFAYRGFLQHEGPLLVPGLPIVVKTPAAGARAAAVPEEGAV